MFVVLVPPVGIPTTVRKCWPNVERISGCAFASTFCDHYVVTNVNALNKLGDEFRTARFLTAELSDVVITDPDISPLPAGPRRGSRRRDAALALLR